MAHNTELRTVFRNFVAEVRNTEDAQTIEQTIGNRSPRGSNAL